MYKSIKLVVAIATVSVFATGCASASSDVPEGPQADAVPIGNVEVSQGIQPLVVQASTACSAANLKAAQDHAVEHHTLWGPSSGWSFPTVTSCSVSGGTIHYTYSYD